MHVSRVGYSQKGVGSSTDVTSSGDSNERESDFSTSGNERSLDEILHKDDSFFRPFEELEWAISVSDPAQK